jgi:hypothetical protein
MLIAWGHPYVYQKRPPDEAVFHTEIHIECNKNRSPGGQL